MKPKDTDSSYRPKTERTAPSQTGGHLATQNLPKHVTNIIGEPNYKYGKQEKLTARNHNRSTAPERPA